MAGTHRLSEDQVAAWRHDGFLFPFHLLDDAALRGCLDGLARFEAWLGAPVNAALDLSWRTMPHLALPWVMDLARDPRVLDRVEDLLGPDILMWTSTFFIKEPRTPIVAAWHQDSTYYGLDPAEEVTVWVALSDADRAAGCMEVLPFDGAPRQMRHAAHVVADSVNRAAQCILEPLDEDRAVAMPLRAGQFSMHHGLCPHRSGPNTADHRRIGLGLNFIPADVRPIGKVRPAAMLVRGTDRWGRFTPVAPPASELDAAAVATHARAVALYGEVYREQEARLAPTST
jgi:hypothetical protein